MRYLAPLVLLCLAIAPVRADEPVTAADAAAVQSVIRQQLDAFNHDKGAAAFGFASPAIQARFQTAETFMTMVRQAYAPIYRSIDAQFGPLRARGDRLVQEVTVTGQDGSTVLATYLMAQQPDGSWKIDGCSLEKLDDLGV